jgi:hypothetical protein
MLKTAGLLNAHFPKDVSKLIVSCIVSRTRNWWYIAHVGEYETCLSIPEIHVNGGLRGACSGGHAEIVKLMIFYGASNLDSGLTGACIFGRREITRLMIAHGAKKCSCGGSIRLHLAD